MARKAIALLVMGTVIFFLCTISSANVPHMINYQGKLTTAAGVCVDDTVQMTFTIYSDSLGTSDEWSETQNQVVVKNGLFNVLLGAVDTIPASVFDGSTKYLGVQVEADPEMTPLKPMVSVAYAYRSLEADTADYARHGGGGIDCHDCETIFVNVIGPDSVVAIAGTAFLGKTSGSSGSTIIGVEGRGENTSTGNATGGLFIADSAGTGWKTGVQGVGYSNTPGGDASGSSGYAENSSSGRAIGAHGLASNWSTGEAYGGFFASNPTGTGDHYGVHAYGHASSSANAYGVEAVGRNSSNGNIYGGFFSTYSEGTGTHYGVRAEGYGEADSITYGAYGYADNTSTGDVYGGFFRTSDNGTGAHYGVRGSGYGASSASTFGSYGYASNTSSGIAYGGYFYTAPSGTGTHKGVSATGLGSSSASTCGVDASASNTSTGNAYGGDFSTSSSGTGDHYGVRGSGYGASSGDTYGAYGYADNTSTGDVYGGQFYTSSSGTGYHCGVRGDGYGSSVSIVDGVRGSAQNLGSGSAYAGYFSVSSSGTGTHYGVYGSETAGGAGAAVYASGDFAGSGAKYAVVKTSQGHRFLSVIESPEVWFEDFGEGELVNGKARIALDPLFLETVTINAQHPMKVFVQLTSGEPMNVVVKKGLTGFDVVAEDPTSMASFDWRLVAKRRGYETERLRETDVGYDDPSLYPELQAERDKKSTEMKEQYQLEWEKHKQDEERRNESGNR